MTDSVIILMAINELKAEVDLLPKEFNLREINYNVTTLEKKVESTTRDVKSFISGEFAKSVNTPILSLKEAVINVAEININPNFIKEINDNTRKQSQKAIDKTDEMIRIINEKDYSPVFKLEAKAMDMQPISDSLLDFKYDIIKLLRQFKEDITVKKKFSHEIVRDSNELIQSVTSTQI